jgi:homoserine kinase
LVDRLREDGIAATVSGAGPTVLAFTTGDGQVAALPRRRAPVEQRRHLDIDRGGVRAG